MRQTKIREIDPISGLLYLVYNAGAQSGADLALIPYWRLREIAAPRSDRHRFRSEHARASQVDQSLALMGCPLRVSDLERRTD